MHIRRRPWRATTYHVRHVDIVETAAVAAAAVYIDAYALAPQRRGVNVAHARI